MFNEDYVSYKNIVGIDVYLEYRKTRKLVGRLSKESGGEKEFIFSYDRGYLNLTRSIPLGPDLPLTKQTHKSKNLFKSLGDRIPSKGNPAYIEYCESFGISPFEKDKIVLLATIGRRGPSSFAFEPVYKKCVSQKARTSYRKKLGLTIREFASVFDFSTKTVQKLESGDEVARDSQKRMDTYILFPEVAILDLNLTGGSLMPSKKEAALQKLKDIEFTKNLLAD